MSGPTATSPAVAIVPTAPLLLPAVSPRQPAHLVAPVAALRRAVRTTLAGVVTTEVVVLLAAGATSTVHRRARVDRTPSGHPQARLEVAVDQAVAEAVDQAVAEAVAEVVDDAVAEALDEAGEAPGSGVTLSGDVGVLAALVADAVPTARVVPVTIAVDGPRDVDVAALARALRRVCSAHGASLVVAGDLSATRDATSPGYVVDGAVAYDDAVVAALRTGDTAALTAIGADEARRVQARADVPVRVAAAVVDGAWPEVALVAPRGVGLLVAASVPTGTALPDAPDAVPATP